MSLDMLYFLFSFRCWLYAPPSFRQHLHVKPRSGTKPSPGVLLVFLVSVSCCMRCLVLIFLLVVSWIHACSSPYTSHCKASSFLLTWFAVFGLFLPATPSRRLRPSTDLYGAATCCICVNMRFSKPISIPIEVEQSPISGSDIRTLGLRDLWNGLSCTRRDAVLRKGGCDHWLFERGKI